MVAFDSWRGQADDGGVVVGGELVAALVGPVVIEVVGVVAEDLLGVTAVEEQDPVGALLADGADEAFGVWVAVRTVWRVLLRFRQRNRTIFTSAGQPHRSVARSSAPQRGPGPRSRGGWFPVRQGAA